MQVGSLDQEDPLDKEMATHSSILAWKILWTFLPGKFHGQRILVGYNPQGREELDATVQASKVLETTGHGILYF